MNTIGYFEIQATNPEKAVEFYTNVFDWRFVKETALPIDYWRIENAGTNGGLLARPVKTPPLEFGTNAYTCSIEVGDFDKIAELILENSGQIAMPKFEIPGRCWQGYFVDTDNNVFGIFQVIDLNYKEKNYMSDKNKEIVKQVNAAFSENNIEGFLNLCTEDVKWTMNGKVIEGKDAIRQFAAMGDMEPPKIDSKNMLAEADSVAAYGEMTMSEKGKIVPYVYCDVYRFENDKIVELNSYVVKTDK